MSMDDPNQIEQVEVDAGTAVEAPAPSRAAPTSAPTAP